VASGIAADDMGNIYAADVGAHNLRKFVSRKFSDAASDKADSDSSTRGDGNTATSIPHKVNMGDCNTVTSIHKVNTLWRLQQQRGVSSVVRHLHSSAEDQCALRPAS
jgi:hypothetical protein